MNQTNSLAKKDLSEFIEVLREMDLLTYPK